MSALEFQARAPRDRLGLKGPRAAEWLTAHGIVLPPAANTWARSSDRAAPDSDRDAPHDALWVARLGTAEFFLEDGARGSALRGMVSELETHPPGVYPVLREDSAFLLSGEGADEVLAQVCNVNFADMAVDSQPIVMTMMIGVAVLVVPERTQAESRYRIWCDPTFGSYLGGAIGAVVIECGGNAGG